MNHLMIVESPTKKGTLEKILGPDWTVVATSGHVQDLPVGSGLGFDKNSLEIYYELSQRGKKIINGLKRHIDYFSRVVVATDSDREGEAIAQHVVDLLDIQNRYERCTFNSITKKTVQAAMSGEMREIDTNLVAAQESRRMLDRFAGWEFGDAVSMYLGQRCPMGRVQSQVVKIIVDRQKEVDNFKQTDHWSIDVLAGETKADTWKASLDVKGSGLGEVVDGDHTCWTDKNAAEALMAQIKQLEVLKSERKETKSSAPPPFETSTLHQSALNTLGFNSKKTDSIAQKLYQLGYITYIRTDSTEISDDAFEMLSQYAEKARLPVCDAKQTGKKGAVDQEAHECIRPSDFEYLGDDLEPGDKELYKLIWTRTMASQLMPATRWTTSTKLATTIDGHEYFFKATGSVPKDKGWRVILEDDDSEDDENRSKKKDEESSQAKNPVPVLGVGDVVTVSDSVLVSKKTTKPTPFTEGTLGAILKRTGVGRPSTYTPTYEKIGDAGHKYVTYDDSKSKDKPYFKPLQRAYDMVNAVGDIFKIMDIEFSGKMEDDLNEIANGNLVYEDFVKGFFSLVDEEIARLQEKEFDGVRYPCEKCGENLVRMPDNKRSDSWWWKCYNKSCGHTTQDLKGKPMTAADKERLHKEKIADFLNDDGSAKFPCPTEGCGKPMIRIASKKKKDTWFWVCSSPKDSGCDRTAFDDKENQVPVYDTKAFWKAKNEKLKRDFSNEDGTPLFPCPNCGSHLLKLPTKKGGFFWGCSTNRDECGFSTWCDKDGNPVMNPEEVKAERAAKKAARMKEICNEDGTPKWPCGKCGSPLDKRVSEKGTVWFGCTSYPKCEASYFDDGTGNPDYEDKGGKGKKKTSKKKSKPKPRIMGAIGRK